MKDVPEDVSDPLRDPFIAQKRNTLGFKKVLVIVLLICNIYMCSCAYTVTFNKSIVG